MAKKLLVALALANLCFIPVWRELLDPSSDNYFYFMKTYPRWVELGALTCNVLLLTALCFPVVSVALRPGRGRGVSAARVLMLLLALVPLNALRLEFGLGLPTLLKWLGKAGVIALALSLLAAAVFACLRLGLEKMARGAAAALLFMSPFVFIANAQGLWVASSYDDAFAERAAAPSPARPAKAPGRRVLWLVFDELDQRLLFAERPPAFEAPEFDRLRAESLYASDAYPPSGFTLISMPALTTGRLVADAKTVGPNGLALQLHEGGAEPTDWRELPNVFSRAHEEGYDTGIVGWYHPYCRLFRASLTRCSWESPAFPPETQAFKGLMLQQAMDTYLSVPVLHRVLSKLRGQPQGSWWINAYKEAHDKMLRDSLAVATDPELELVMIHLMPPHSPNFYNRATRQFTADGRSSYLDSLALADRCLGEIRAAMERAGMWDNTTVLVSSDHWWRASRRFFFAGKLGGTGGWTEEDTRMMPAKPDERVPFLLKFAGRNEARVYGEPFNTLLSPDLLMALLRGEVADGEGAARWLDTHKTIAKSPYFDLRIPVGDMPH